MCLERLARDARRRGETALLQETKLALHQWAVRVIGDVERVGHDVSQDQRNVALAVFCRIEGALKDEESDVARMIAQVRHPDDTLRGMAADSVGHYLSEVVPSPEMRLRMLDEVSDLLMDDTAWFDALQILRQADPDWRTRVRSVIASGRLGEATEDVLRRSLDQ